MRKTTWNTFSCSGYTHDVANCQSSAGGVHLHQIRRTKRGFWQKRIKQSNGNHAAFGPVTPLDDQIGEANYAQAENY